jgi:hypothetical protein
MRINKLKTIIITSFLIGSFNYCNSPNVPNKLPQNNNPVELIGSWARTDTLLSTSPEITYDTLFIINDSLYTEKAYAYDSNNNLSGYNSIDTSKWYTINDSIYFQQTYQYILYPDSLLILHNDVNANVIYHKVN